MNTIYQTRPTFQEVYDAVRKMMTEIGSTASLNARHETARRLGFPEMDNRFYRQVYRALDQLVKDGVLVRLGRGEPWPGASDSVAGEVYFYTHAAYKNLVDKGALESRKQALIRERWEYVYDRLAASGYFGFAVRGEPIKLSVATWETLIAALDASEGKDLLD